MRSAAVQVHCDRKRFRGLSRSPWSLTWDSHVPLAAAGSEAGTNPNTYYLN